MRAEKLFLIYGRGFSFEAERLLLLDLDRS